MDDTKTIELSGATYIQLFRDYPEAEGIVFKGTKYVDQPLRDKIKEVTLIMAANGMISAPYVKTPYEVWSKVFQVDVENGKFDIVFIMKEIACFNPPVIWPIMEISMMVDGRPIINPFAWWSQCRPKTAKETQEEQAHIKASQDTSEEGPNIRVNFSQ